MPKNETAEWIVREIPRKTRKKYPAEEKIRKYDLVSAFMSSPSLAMRLSPNDTGVLISFIMAPRKRHSGLNTAVTCRR